MARSFEKIRNEALQLSIEERSWLAESLFDSVRTDEQREIADEWLAVAEKRLADLDSGKTKPIPAEEVLRELKARYSGRGRRRR